MAHICPYCREKIDLQQYKKTGRCSYCGQEVDLPGESDAKSEKKKLKAENDAARKGKYRRMSKDEPSPKKEMHAGEERKEARPAKARAAANPDPSAAEAPAKHEDAQDETKEARGNPLQKKADAPQRGNPFQGGSGGASPSAPTSGGAGVALTKVPAQEEEPAEEELAAAAPEEPDDGSQDLSAEWEPLPSEPEAPWDDEPSPEYGLQMGEADFGHAPAMEEPDPAEMPEWEPYPPEEYMPDWEAAFPETASLEPQIAGTVGRPIGAADAAPASDVVGTEDSLYEEEYEYEQEDEYEDEYEEDLTRDEASIFSRLKSRMPRRSGRGREYDEEDDSDYEVEGGEEVPIAKRIASRFAKWKKKEKKERGGERLENPDLGFTSNEDGYYDDVKPPGKETEDRFILEVAIRIAVAILGMFATANFLIFYF